MEELKPKISCIIPAHNEAQRIETVLRAAAGHPLLYEVIVVDDGSKDGTSEVVKKFSNIRLIVLKKNVGKSGAVYEGLVSARGEFICLLDADLLGITAEDITALVRPITSGAADVSISLRINSPWIDRKIGIDFISGERVFHKSLLTPHLEEVRRLSGFGLEVFMNRIIIRKRQRIKIAYWPNVKSPYPHEKVGIFRGIRGFARMILHIFKTVSPLEAGLQIFHMWRLRV